MPNYKRDDYRNKNEYYQNTLVTPMSALKFSLKRVNSLLTSKKWVNTASA